MQRVRMGPGCGSEFRGAFGLSTHQIRDPEFWRDRERPRQEDL